MQEATEQQQPAPAPAPDPFATTKGIKPSAWKMLIYGVPGVGKSTLAASAPSPVFLDLENGLARVDCEKTPEQLKSMDQVKNWLRHLIGRQDCKTIVIDTIDEIEKMLGAAVVTDWNRNNAKVKTVSDIPYGRGGDLLVAYWKDFLEIFDHLVAAGKNVLLTGHEQVIKFENPTDANYDFYSVNVHKKAAPVVTAKLDAVLFARFESYVTDKNDKGKGKAVASGNRILLTSQGTSWVAKNRFSLQPVEPMEPSIFTKIH